MPSFSSTSRERLFTCSPKLKELFNEVIKTYDCTIICGHRTAKEQNKAFAEGKSHKRYPLSKHNVNPSRAVDVAPYPIDWNDTQRFYHFAGYVQAIAEQMRIKIRWGGDWDSDFRFHDQTFNDLVHFELID